MTRHTLQPVILCFLSASLGGFFAIHWSENEPDPNGHGIAPHPVSSSRSLPHSAVPALPTGAFPTPSPTPDFRGAAHRALEAVVHVRTAERVPQGSGWYDWSGLFQPQKGSTQIQTGSGSGVILDARGYIVTNHHVIEGADVIEVGLHDNRSLPAELIGSDPTTDIAVLKVDAKGLSALEWGDSDEVMIGDWVLAVGNPFDLTNTVTAGIVSAKARDIQLLRPDFDRALFPIESFIQTDAAVNPGNSGGALVDAQGRMIGINTAIASRTGSYAGYAFAVPANLARKVALDLMEFGSVQRAYLGVGIRPVDESIAERLSLPSVSGVLVSSISENSGAEKAGMKPGDVILSVGGTSTGTMPQLLERVNRYRPGQSTQVEVWRDGTTQRFDVELGTRGGLASEEDSEETAWMGETQERHTGSTASALGCTVESTEDESGVKIKDAGKGAFARAGIEAGMTVVSIDGKSITDVDDFKEALDPSRTDGAPGILIEILDEQGKTRWFGLDLD